MKALSPLLLLLLAPSAYATGMTAVPITQGYCEGRLDPASLCYEWALTADPSIRFVAIGYKGSIEYSFHRLSPHDTYEQVIRVYPVIRDGSRTGALFWGYPWDITDIAVPEKKDQGQFLASFEHAVTGDDDVQSAAWQKRVPVVLFSGQTTQRPMTVAPIDFTPTTLQAMRSQASD